MSRFRQALPQGPAGNRDRPPPPRQAGATPLRMGNVTECGRSVTMPRRMLAILPALPPGLPRAELMRRLEDEVETASAALLGNFPAPAP